MTLSMLTTSGWVWLWLTLTVVGATFGQPIKTRARGAEMISAAMVAWTLWLVTP